MPNLPSPRRTFLGLALSLAIGTITPAQEADPGLREILAKVEAKRIGDDVKHLATYPSRNSGSEGIVEAGQWLHDRFKALGYQVAFHEFPLRGKTCRNVVATKLGATDPRTFVVIGAHYDSRSKNLFDAKAPAPGADDNASGTSGLLEIARILAQVETPCSIRLIAFSGEEQGLVGSTAYARKATADKLSIRAMLNMDMIGHPIDADRVEVMVESDEGNRRKENDAQSKDYAERMIRAAADYTRLKPKAGPLYGTDYMPFEAEGFVCLGVFDGADKKPFYHTEEDAPDVVDPEYAAEVVRMVLATAIDIARRP